MYAYACHEDNHHYYFFNDTAATEIYTLSLHDALPICKGLLKAGLSLHLLLALKAILALGIKALLDAALFVDLIIGVVDRKSTRLNSSHANISYAVFCLKKRCSFRCL